MTISYHYVSSLRVASKEDYLLIIVSTKETIENVIHCLTILHHMVRDTLENFNEAVEKQRAQEITQYLQNIWPTVSGSDSPSMNSTFVGFADVVHNWVKASTTGNIGKYNSGLLIKHASYCLHEALLDTWAHHCSHTCIHFTSVLSYGYVWITSSDSMSYGSKLELMAAGDWAAIPSFYQEVCTKQTQ
ncbi:hypothetical protein BDR04DRAFT_1113013 [Suillus decipiens]|nr:hypothetical protein BDR04DRAFT_1113013 [Suillus decipiens]